MAYGTSTSTTSWEPSVKYLLVLLLAEIFIVGVLRSLTNHGG
jgi:hypothetical protein